MCGASRIASTGDNDDVWRCRLKCARDIAFWEQVCENPVRGYIPASQSVEVYQSCNSIGLRLVKSVMPFLMWCG